MTSRVIGPPAYEPLLPFALSFVPRSAATLPDLAKLSELCPFNVGMLPGSERQRVVCLVVFVNGAR
jgi:hypothetical protein